ncbi:MAG: NUDIX hydrolase, partial [Bdellovibrio sp.]
MRFQVKRNQRVKTKTKIETLTSVRSKNAESSRSVKKRVSTPRPPKHHLAPRLGWKIHRSRYLVWDRFMNVRQDDVSIGRRRFRYTYLDHPGAVFAIGITPNRELVLIRLFRYPLDEWCWEIPSGGLGDKAGKSPLRVAKEELLEEAGGIAKKWTS